MERSLPGSGQASCPDPRSTAKGIHTIFGRLVQLLVGDRSHHHVPPPIPCQRICGTSSAMLRMMVSAIFALLSLPDDAGQLRLRLRIIDDSVGDDFMKDTFGFPKKMVSLKRWIAFKSFLPGTAYYWRAMHGTFNGMPSKNIIALKTTVPMPELLGLPYGPALDCDLNILSGAN